MIYEIYYSAEAKKVLGKYKKSNPRAFEKIIKLFLN
jgi:hypothetical protein